MPNHALTVRPATLKDAPTMRALAQKTAMTERTLNRVYSDEAIRATLDSENRHVLLAFSDDDALVGLCQYGIPIMDDCDCEDLRAIHTLILHPDYEASDDVRMALIEAVEDTINVDAGVQRLSLYVPADDMARIKFYARLGFHHEMIEDTPNEWYMEKDL
ncbi:MAG: GNAT family N-acetyltransferase [Chloroflexota bacterium]